MTRAFSTLMALLACAVALAAAPAPPPAPAPAPADQSPAPPATPSEQPSRRVSYSDRYSILSERNIFLRDRSRGSSNGIGGSTTNPSASTQPSRRLPEETLLLTGIVLEDGEYRAYVEDQVNARILRVSQGDAIARGRVVSIELDAIEYEMGGIGGSASTGSSTGDGGAEAKRTFVAIGNDLTGRQPAFSGGFDAAAMATTSPVMPTGVDGLNPNDPNLTMEQRLKLRRMQELKK